ncbi:hypothetical protein [Pseudomonas xionganensis]|uniref:Lysozyme n=1 Tax=Pseudomonas xionganensis TaxID=2654845 RepID=A0A6I4KXA2_9PSED|nr:hypothetical protein [Pseudomonas xionganensis]MVW75402.1 hypothetical protein [Pseudomonas xionganensis]
MTLTEIRAQAIAPALALLPGRMSEHRPAVEVLLLTTHLQEAPNREQCQLPVRPGKCGPARGIFQFERGGGVAGVLRHPASRPHVFTVCAKLGVVPTLDGIFDALPSQCDVLDAALARLLYWTDRNPLPALGDVEGAWQYYLHNWRPGAWERGTPAQRQALRRKWGLNYAKAMDEVRA